MAYLTKRERNDLSKDVHRTYAWRKILIVLDVILLAGFIVMIFLGSYFSLTDDNWSLWKESAVPFRHVKDLTPFGIGMLVWAIILVLLSASVIILTFSMHSPNKVTKQVLELESAPLNNKKIDRKASISDINRERVEGRKVKK